MISLLGRKTKGAASASVAIGTATCFVLVAACVSLLIDHGTAPAASGAGWTLRGGVPPIDVPPLRAPKGA